MCLCDCSTRSQEKFVLVLNVILRSCNRLVRMSLFKQVLKFQCRQKPKRADRESFNEVRDDGDVTTLPPDQRMAALNLLTWHIPTSRIASGAAKFKAQYATPWFV